MGVDYSKLSATSIRNREELVQAARSYVGVPFRHRGRDRQGIDCGGLIIAALRDLGYTPPDFTVYGREPDKDGLKQYLDHAIGNGARANARFPIPGDVLLMSFNAGHTPQHVALVARHPTSKSGALSIIHSYGEIGKVVEHGYDSAWRSRTRFVYRFDLLTDCSGCTGFDQPTPPPAIDGEALV